MITRGTASPELRVEQDRPKEENHGCFKHFIFNSKGYYRIVHSMQRKCEICNNQHPILNVVLKYLDSYQADDEEQ